MQLKSIDDRLIHGQVMTSWLRVYHDAKEVLVVDDEVAKDPFMTQMFGVLLPKGIGIEILNVDDAVAKFEKGLDTPTFMLVKFPLTIKRLVDAGVEIDYLNIGGMGMSGDRKKFYQNIAASEEEKQILQELIDGGMKIEIQITAQKNKVDVASLLKK